MTEFELIHGLVDGNLSDEDRAEAQARLFSDPNFKAHFEFAAASKKAVREQCTGVDCEETWAKCRDRLNQIDRARKVEHNVSKYAWAMVAGLTLLIGGVGIINRSDRGGRMHTSDLPSLNASLVPQAGIPSNMGRWLNGQGIQVQPDRVRVTGFAHGYNEGREAFRINLRDRVGDMALMIVQDSEGVDGTWSQEGSEFKYGQIESLHFVTWNHDGRAMMLVGDRSLEELQSIAEAISQR